MHRLILAAFMLASYIVAAQKNKPDSVRRLCKSMQGQLLGKPVSTQIGKDGGIVQWEDGRLQLHFPQGALTNNTAISIQPQTNTMPSGLGTGYRMEPSGTVFDKDVKVVWKYNEAELGTGSKALLSLALQNSGGQWSAVKNVSFDTIRKTITGFIRHFSSLVVYQKALLIPRSATVPVGEQYHFVIYMFTTVQDFDYAEIWEMEYRSVLYEDGFFDTQDIPVWRVNGIKNGNAVLGTLSTQNDGYATYTAPAEVPADNPVTVSVEMEMDYVKHPTKIVLPSNVFIVDKAYRFTFIGHSKHNGVLQVIDSSTCDISITKDGRLELVNIVNHEPWSDWPAKNKAGCELTYPNKAAWKGVVEITGMRAHTYTPATANNPLASFMISLVPAMGNTPNIKEDCKCRGCTIRELPILPMPAQPTYIRFEAGGDDINIEYMGIKGKGEIRWMKNNEGFIIKVRRL